MTGHRQQAATHLRARMIEDMTVRGFGSRTRSDYVRYVRAFAAFIGRGPDTATAGDLRRFHLKQSAFMQRGFAVLKQIISVSCLLAGTAVLAQEAGNLTQAPPEPYAAVSDLVELPEFLPGLGQLYVDPETLPAGPFLGYDRDGKLSATIYMPPLEDLQGGTAYNDLALGAAFAADRTPIRRADPLTAPRRSLASQTRQAPLPSPATSLRAAREIFIDRASPLRVRFLEAFGRRPRAKRHTHDWPASETLHIIGLKGESFLAFG